jgi:hypothetical protein
MNLQVLVFRYIENAEKVLAEIRLKHRTVPLDGGKIRFVIENAKQYLSDAKYYRGKKQFGTSLAAVCYCEGLLDALRLLETVEFTWPNSKE